MDYTGKTLDNSLRVKTLQNSLRVKRLDNSLRVKTLDNSLRVKRLDNSLRVKRLDNSLRVKNTAKQTLQKAWQLHLKTWARIFGDPSPSKPLLLKEKLRPQR